MAVSMELKTSRVISIPSDSEEGRAPRRGRPRVPDSLVGRIIAFLAAHPNQAFRAHEIVEALGEEEQIAIVRPMLRTLSRLGRMRKVARGLFAANDVARRRKKEF
jgi:hypothetical protein